MPHPEHERAELVQLRIVVIRMELSPEPCGIDLASRCVQEVVTHRYKRWPTTGAQVAAVRHGFELRAVMRGWPRISGHSAHGMAGLDHCRLSWQASVISDGMAPV